MGDGDAGPKMMEAFQLVSIVFIFFKLQQCYFKRQKEFKEERQRREEQYNQEFLNRVGKKESELKHREEAVSFRYYVFNIF